MFASKSRTIPVVNWSHSPQQEEEQEGAPEEEGEVEGQQEEQEEVVWRGEDLFLPK